MLFYRLLYSIYEKNNHPALVYLIIRDVDTVIDITAPEIYYKLQQLFRNCKIVLKFFFLSNSQISIQIKFLFTPVTRPKTNNLSDKLLYSLQ